MAEAVIAQLGERQTEDLEVLGSIPSPGIIFRAGPPKKTRTTAPDSCPVRKKCQLWGSNPRALTCSGS
jgi:hypothetical protein